MTVEPTSQPLDGGYPLAPMCEEYINRETLGTEEDRLNLIEVVADMYRVHPGPNHTTTPRTYARRFVATLDPVTVNIFNGAWKNGAIDQSDLHKVVVRQRVGIDARNYALLKLGTSDLGKSAGFMRQFDGLHDMAFEDGQERLISLDLSLDKRYSGYRALLRYTIAVTDQWSASMRGVFRTRNGDDFVIDPSVAQLILDHRSQVDTIAKMVVDRKSQDVETLREGLRLHSSLSEGAL